MLVVIDYMFGDMFFMKNKPKSVNLKNNEMFVVFRPNKNLFKDIVFKVLDEDIKFKIMRDLFVAYCEFDSGEGVCFSLLDGLDNYFDDEK